MKKIIATILMFTLLFSISPAVFAASNDTGFTDVSRDAWYAGAVDYVQESNLMDGASGSAFAPNIIQIRQA